MRNGVILFILIAVASLTCCKSSKVIKRDIEIESSRKVIESKIDKSSTTLETSSHVSVENKIEEIERTRTTIYDERGKIRATQETWRETGSTGTSVRNDSSRAVSLNDIEEESEESENKNIDIKESEEVEKDSTVMKNSGWFWFWMCLALIVVLYFTIKQKIK